MSQSMRLALGGGLGGLMLGLAILFALHGSGAPLPAQRASQEALQELGAVRDSDPMSRCRVATAPDPACAAAWEAEQHRFFARPAP